MKTSRPMVLAAISLALMATSLAAKTPIPREILKEFRVGTGPDATPWGAGLLIEIPADPLSDASGIFGAGVSTVCKLAGDFDVRVKYHQVQWPESNGVRFGMKVADVAIERTSFTSSDAWPEGEAYLDSRFIPGSIYTSDILGQMRVTRAGHVIATYYRSPSTGGFWKQTGKGAGTAAPTPVTVAAWSHPPYFIYEMTKILAFDLTLQKGAWVEEECRGLSGDL